MATIILLLVIGFAGACLRSLLSPRRTAKELPYREETRSEYRARARKYL